MCFERSFGVLGFGPCSFPVYEFIQDVLASIENMKLEFFHAHGGYYEKKRKIVHVKIDTNYVATKKRKENNLRNQSA